MTSPLSPASGASSASSASSASRAVYFVPSDARVLHDRLEELESNAVRWGHPELQRWAAGWLLTLNAMPSVAHAMANAYYQEADRLAARVTTGITAEVGLRFPSGFTSEERLAVFGLQRDLMLYPPYREPAHVLRDARWIEQERLETMRSEAIQYTVMLPRDVPGIVNTMLRDVEKLSRRAEPMTEFERQSMGEARSYAGTVVDVLRNTPGTPEIAVWLCDQVEKGLDRKTLVADGATAATAPATRVRAAATPGASAADRRGEASEGTRDRPSDTEVRAVLEDALDLLHANRLIDPRCGQVAESVRAMAARVLPEVPVPAPLQPVVSLESTLSWLTDAIAAQRAEAPVGMGSGT